MGTEEGLLLEQECECLSKGRDTVDSGQVGVPRKGTGGPGTSGDF